MTHFKLIVVHVIFTTLTSSLCLDHYKHEAHVIMKRMAEMDPGFEGHDVARVHTVEEQGQRKRRLAKRDLREFSRVTIGKEKRHLQLDLSAGSKVNLALKPAGVVGPYTMVSIHTGNGHVENRSGLEDCYSHGQIEDSTGEGWASVSHCNGLFGFARSPEFEYFLHPAGVNRAKREADKNYDVHVLWRRTEKNQTENSTTAISETVEDFIIPRVKKVARRLKGKDVDRLNATGIVIELAMFSDEQYLKQLKRVFPGREDDFLLTRLAATQALYSNREKVGFDVQIKLKSMVYWTTNPVGYTFSQKLSHNLRSFCSYTQNKYFYDLHSLNTGVTDWNKGKVGLAYVRGACSKKRCMITKGTDIKTFVLYAHELGHTLGLTHHANAKCPSKMKSVGGFMGGGTRYNFSPCMKQQLAQFLKMSRSNCLFKESGETKTLPGHNDLPNVFPGQRRSPDGLCELMAGADYKYVPVVKSNGNSVCQWLVCLNENMASPDFGRARRFDAPTGFPCGVGYFCLRDRVCYPWNNVLMTPKMETLQNMTRIPEWSEWSADLSDCSRTCGTGVRTRRRECQYTGYSMAPYCPGMSVKPELCNTQPCRGESRRPAILRRTRGYEVCSRFLRNKVKLNLKKRAKAYRPTSRGISNRDVSSNVGFVHSKSCLLKCNRKPRRASGDLDAFMPDGTPCLDSKRSRLDLKRLKINLRCVRGFCLEFNASHVKDECDICGCDGSRCVQIDIDSSFDVPRGRRRLLTLIPAGSTSIEVIMKRKKNRGVQLELWDPAGKKIIGKRGRYPRATYISSKAVPFAGTRWSYRRSVSFLRAPGPTLGGVTIKAFRQRRPIREITIRYVKSPDVQVMPENSEGTDTAL